MESQGNIKICNRRSTWGRYLAVGAVGALCAPVALLPAPGAAQSLDPAELQELDDDGTDITHEELTIDQIEDMDVVRDGEVIGEVEEVLGNDDGEIVAIVLEYGGNVVGIGDKEVIVPVDELEFPAGRNEIETTMTDEELAELTPWER